MAFTDIAEHVLEAFHSDPYGETLRGIELKASARKRQARERAKHLRQRRQARPPRVSRGLVVGREGQVCLTGSEVPPGRWTRANGKWVRAL